MAIAVAPGGAALQLMFGRTDRTSLNCFLVRSSENRGSVKSLKRFKRSNACRCSDVTTYRFNVFRSDQRSLQTMRRRLFPARDDIARRARMDNSEDAFAR